MDYNIKPLQSDWVGGIGYLHFLTTNGIHHRVSCLGSHQQNESAKRKHRHIVDKGLALLAQASMPIKFWDEAFRTDVYLINKLPTLTLNGSTPLEIFLKLHLNMIFLESLAILAFQSERFSST